MHVAAEQKAISQPALTKSLRVLEQEVGAALFERTPKGLEPTEAGEALYRYACAIDQEARIAAMDVGRLTHELRRGVRLGVGPALAASWFASVLAHFRRDFPAIEITVQTGLGSRLVDAMTRSRLDAVISSRPQQGLPERFTHMELFSSPMVAISRPGHPLQTGRRVALAELPRFGRVSFVADREFDINARAALGDQADTMRPMVETDSTAIMLGLLGETDCYAIVSDLMVPRAEREGLAVLPLDRPLWSISIDLMCKASFIQSRPVASLRASVLACVGAANAGAKDAIA